MASSSPLLFASRLWLTAALLQCSICGISWCTSTSVTFSKDSYLFRVKEGVPVHTSFGTVSAMSSRANIRVLYRILNTIPEESLVAVSGRGDLTTITTIDRESLPDGLKLFIVAEAINAAGDMIANVTTTAVVEIQDVNDNFPVLLEDHFHIMTSLTRGSVVGRIVAMDEDASPGMSYHVLPGTGPHTVKDLFTLNSSTGVLTLNGNVPSNVARVDLIIQARNTEHPFLVSPERTYTVRVGLKRQNNTPVVDKTGTVRNTVSANNGQLCFTGITINAICSSPQTLLSGLKLGCNLDPLSAEMKQVTVSLQGQCTATTSNGGNCDSLAIPASTSGISISHSSDNRTLFLSGFHKMADYVGLLTTLQYHSPSGLASRSDGVTVLIKAENTCGQSVYGQASSSATEITPVQVAVNGATGRVTLSATEKSSAAPFEFGQYLDISGGSCQTLVKAIDVVLDSTGPPGEEALRASTSQRHGISLTAGGDNKRIHIESVSPNGLPVANFSNVLRSLQYAYATRANGGVRPPARIRINGTVQVSWAVFLNTEVAITVRGICQPEVADVSLDYQMSITPLWASVALPGSGPKTAALYPWVVTTASASTSSDCAASQYRRCKSCIGKNKVVLDVLRGVQSPKITGNRDGGELRMDMGDSPIQVASAEFADKSNRYFFISTKFHLETCDTCGSTTGVGGSIVQLVHNTNSVLLGIGANASGVWLVHSNVYEYVPVAGMDKSIWHHLVISFDTAVGYSPLVLLYLDGVNYVVPSTMNKWLARLIPSGYQIVIGGRQFRSGTSGYVGRLAGLLLGAVSLQPKHVSCLRMTFPVPCFFDVSSVNPASNSIVNGYGIATLHSVTIKIITSLNVPKLFNGGDDGEQCQCYTSLRRRESLCSGDNASIDLLDNIFPPPPPSDELVLDFNGSTFYAINRSFVDYGGKEIEDFTVSAWFRQVQDNRGYLFAIHTARQRRLAIYLNAKSKKMSVFLFGENANDENTYPFPIAELGDDKWHHLAVTRQGTIIKAFVDGKTISQHDVTPIYKIPIPPTYYWYVGARPDLITPSNAKFLYKGSFAGVTLSEKAVSADTVKCLAGTGSTNCVPCLVATLAPGIKSSYDMQSHELKISGDRSTSHQDMQTSIRSVQYRSDAMTTGTLRLKYTFNNLQGHCVSTRHQNITIKI